MSKPTLLGCTVTGVRGQGPQNERNEEMVPVPHVTLGQKLIEKWRVDASKSVMTEYKGKIVTRTYSLEKDWDPDLILLWEHWDGPLECPPDLGTGSVIVKKDDGPMESVGSNRELARGSSSRYKNKGKEKI